MEDSACSSSVRSLVSMLDTRESSMATALERFLRTDGRQLGVGRDVSGTRTSYNALRLACAWRIDHPAQRDSAAARTEKVSAQMRLLARKGRLSRGDHRAALRVREVAQDREDRRL